MGAWTSSAPGSDDSKCCIWTTRNRIYGALSASSTTTSHEASGATKLRIMAIACYELQRKKEESSAQPHPDDPQLSFKVVQFIPDLSFRQTLLAMRSEAERITHINQFFPQYLAELKRATHVKRVGPTNGHGFIALGKKDP